MWVKICANTNLEDAALAAELGADAVGFVFAPSVRQVTPAQVGAITQHLPKSLERVGVFPAWELERIVAAVEEAGLTTVQLHGGVDMALLRGLQDRLKGRVGIIQTVHWTVASEDEARHRIEAAVHSQIDRLAASAGVDRVLVDSKVGAATGGTGIPFDWSAAKSVFARSTAGPRLILAGGLRPENVTEAVRQLAPWGVDVASGVELSAGKKDAAKMKLFIERARSLQERPPTSGPDAETGH